MLSEEDKFFRAWDCKHLGFGYGTGEGSTNAALLKFFGALSDGNMYSYLDIEKALGPIAGWLTINLLCHAGAIEYGTSPRFGWLTAEGQRLREYVASRTPNELEEVLLREDPEES